MRCKIKEVVIWFIYLINNFFKFYIVKIVFEEENKEVGFGDGYNFWWYMINWW